MPADRNGESVLQPAHEAIERVANIIKAESSDAIKIVRDYDPSIPELTVDRERAKQLGLALTDVYQTLQILLGGSQVNDFTRYGRNFRVVAQADTARLDGRPADARALFERAKTGFNTRFDRTVERYVGSVSAVVDRKWLFLGIYLVILAVLAILFLRLARVKLAEDAR